MAKSDEINVKRSALVLPESIFKDKCKNKSNIKVNNVKKSRLKQASKLIIEVR